MSQEINPWRLFHGAYVPEWLMRSKSVGPGAKLCYARLCRFAGQKGVAHPEQAELAEELAVDIRTVQRYVKELVDAGMVRVEQRGMGKPNRYFFLKHPEMEEDADTTDVSGLDTTDVSRSETTDVSRPSSPRESASESSSRAVRRDVPKRERPAQKRWQQQEDDDLETTGRLEDETPAPRTNLRLLKPRQGWTTHTLVESFAQRALDADVPAAARDTNKGALGKTIKKWLREETATPDAVAAAMDTFFVAPATRLLGEATLWLAFVNHYSTIAQAPTTSLRDPDYYQEPSVKHSLAAWAAGR